MILDKNCNATDVTDLRIVKTFYTLLNAATPEGNIIGYRLGCWNWSFLSNRIQVFFSNSITTRLELRRG